MYRSALYSWDSHNIVIGMACDFLCATFTENIKSPYISFYGFAKSSNSHCDEKSNKSIILKRCYPIITSQLLLIWNIWSVKNNILYGVNEQSGPKSAQSRYLLYIFYMVNP